MAASAAVSRSRSDSPLLSIGQVLARLMPEFADITPSKLRFLEEQGLVAPARTASGYRKFCGADIDRLRIILAAQRDHYLPLKVIRGYLTELDAGGNPPLPGTTTTAASILSATRTYSRGEMLTQCQAPANLLDEAVSAGILPAVERYTPENADILRSLMSLGTVGIEPRHLRGLRAAAEREVALIETALAPVLRHSRPSRRADAHERGREIAAQIDVVRGALVRQAIDGLRP